MIRITSFRLASTPSWLAQTGIAGLLRLDPDAHRNAEHGVVPQGEHGELPDCWPVASTSDLLYDSGRQITPVATLADSVFLWTRSGGADQLVRYGVLLVLAAAIATGGVIRDSTATVIGAMIVAPLATPIIAVALGIITVRPGQVARSAAIVAGSIAAVIALGAVLSWILRDPVNVMTNSQIQGRISPNLTDLFVAFATGLVGAYAQSRRDVSPVLPGVAIAISLVPPLATSGVCLTEGYISYALGAFTLFLANAVAMILSGLLVFTIAGYRRSARDDARRTRRAMVVVWILFGVTVIPLAYATVTTAYQAQVQQEATTAAESWLSGSAYSLATVSFVDGQVVLRVVGTGPLPPQEGFNEAFTSPLGRPVDVVVEQVAGQTVALGSVS